MRKLGEISTMAIILFLIMSIPQFIEESIFKVQLIAFSSLFLGVSLIMGKFRTSKKIIRGLLKG